jgi:hypothetical protein
LLDRCFVFGRFFDFGIDLRFLLFGQFDPGKDERTIGGGRIRLLVGDCPDHGTFENQRIELPTILRQKPSTQITTRSREKSFSDGSTE